MGVETWVWIASLVVLVGILVIDLMVIGRRPHEPSFRESTIWVSIYVGLAVLFGLGIWYFAGMEYAGQFYTGWLTEYSLSVDNLFVFVIIMARFAVPRHLQQKVLLIGIVLALVMRGAFIAAGAALISQFVWVFYIFGLFLLYTAAKLVSNGTISDDDYRENVLVRVSRRILPISREYDSRAHFFTTTPAGKRVFTPLIVVMIAIGTTDLVFALDSIPAIFGLTKEPYIVFATNVFALMGLRQLYFLLGGLLDRLKYLSYGLAIVLAFIGVKLVLEALHENNVPFINGGEPVEWVPTISIGWSLAVIVATLGVTTVFSLVSSNREQAAAAADGKRMRARVKADQRIERN